MLTRLVRLGRRSSEEDGAVLVAVIGLMAVGLLVVSLVSASAISGLGHTSAVRAGVQSQAAAEAGIDAARAVVDKNGCTNSLIDHSNATLALRYKVQISWRGSVSGTWANRCPLNQRGQVRYTATGYANAVGSAGQSANDISRVESIYSAPAVTTINGTGAAIYSYGTAGGTAYDGLIGTLSGAGASVQAYNGSASCNGVVNLLGVVSLTSMTADVLLRNGSFSMSSCAVTGNVSASDSVTLNGSLLTASKITGKVTTPTLYMNGLTAVTGTSLLRTAPVLSSGLLIGAPITPAYTLSAAPPVPVVAPWTEFNYQGQSQWPGYLVSTLTPATCNYLSVLGVITAFGASKGVIDAQACTTGTFLTGLSITALRNDIAIIVPNNQNVQIGGLVVSAGAHNLTIVQPDSDLTDGVPTCPTGGAISMGGINLSIAGQNLMVYTPCTYTESAALVSALAFSGQIYAGKAAVGGALVSARVQNYVAVGLPGVDLTTGQSTATGARALLSTRNVLTGP